MGSFFRKVLNSSEKNPTKNKQGHNSYYNNLYTMSQIWGILDMKHWTLSENNQQELADVTSEP